MSPNARTVLIAFLAAVVSFALGRVTSESVSPERAPSGGDVPATLTSAPRDQQLAASAPVAPSSARVAIVPDVQPESHPDATLASLDEPLVELSDRDAARRAEFIELYRATFDLDVRHLSSASLSWSEAKLAIRPEFELSHERAELLRNFAFDFEHTPSPEGRWYDFGLDAREHSASRIVGAVGGFVGAYPLPPDAAERALAIVHAHRARITPLVEEAVDLYEQALLDAWRDERYPIWRDGAPHPIRSEREENGRLPRESYAGSAYGWKFEFDFDSLDHPALEAALAEIEALKIACIEELAALGS
jgi:hypothetical protein